MKQLIIKLIILISALPLCVQAQFSATDRQPFSELDFPASHSTVDSNKSDGFFYSGMKKGPSGPGIQPPNGDDGDGGWVGSDTEDAPIHDTCGILLLLAIAYGVIKRKKTHTDYTDLGRVDVVK